jgi:formylglycine-generating enzyme required for sulfatase activity
VYYFADDSPPIITPRGEMRSRPTYANLKRFFREWFQSAPLSVGDNFWFFFAGHGELHEEHDYLLPIDVDPGDIPGTALRVSDIADSLRNCGADNTVLLVDACRDRGKRKGQGFGVEAQKGTITIYSCSPNQSSYEIEALQHGAFTYALLEGLRLQGANNCATVERLDQHLCAQVPALNERYGKPSQTPRTSVEPISKNYLILIPKQATRLQDVMALKNSAYRAERDDDLALAQQLWVRVLAASPADQDAIKAIGHIAIRQNQQTTSSFLPLTTLPPATAGSRKIDNPTPKAQVPPSVPKSDQVSLTPRAATPVVKSSPANIPTPSQPRQQPLPQQFRPTIPDGLANRISRRKAIQILGFTGGGVGTVLLGRRLSERWKLPRLEPEKTNGSIAEFNVATVDTQAKKISIERRQAEFRSEDLGNGIALDLMAISGGSFQMGSPDGQGYDKERPQHPVTVKPFFMGKHQVTQAQWQAVTALPKAERDLEANQSSFKGDNLPVDQVSWYDAVEFCKRLSKHTGREYRLPSEAEWEYACRAGTTTAFHFGETLTSDLANYDATETYGDGPKGQYREQTTEVGNFPANAFGLYDIHGNVWEWCQDHWHENYVSAPANGSAWLSTNENAGRMLRGGSWDDNPRYCRSAARLNVVPGTRYNYGFGFRVSCSAPRTLP